MRPSPVVVRLCTVALALLLAISAPLTRSALGQPPAAPGDPLPRIQCPPGYTARVLAQGLDSPDGLAIGPDGALYVAEERAGRVSRIDAAGTVTPVLSGLDHPEGIAFDAASGDLYVVEDVQNGRLLKMDAQGGVTTLAQDLEAPEGVTVRPGGPAYVTESNLQFALAVQLRTRVAAVSESGLVTRVITSTPVFEGEQVRAWSYAGITSGPDGRLYVTNELSDVEIARTLIVSSTDSVFAIDGLSGERELLASGLVAPEGLHFAPGGAWPLYVAEEDVGGNEGRITAIDADGHTETFCTGFGTIEDVVVGGDGTLYVSEDRNGLVVAVARDPVEPAPVADFFAAPRAGLAPLTVAFTNTSSGPYLSRMWAFGDGQTSILEDPLHTYPAPGRYAVTLTVVGPGGSDSRTRSDYITVLWGGYLPLVVRP